MANYFDFHLHTSLKTYMSGTTNEERDDCWTTYDSAIGIVKSQSSLEQIKAGGLSVVVNAVYSMEKVFSSAFLTRYIAPALSPMDPKMMATLATADYRQRLLEEIDALAHCATAAGNTRYAFKIINSVDEIEVGKINIILAIEGGHSLEMSNMEFVDSLADLKAGPHRFLYLTLTHFIQFHFATHAYGMKLIKKHDILKPKGLGLTPKGQEIIDLAYRETAGSRRILIDVKHMSLVARRQFYAYREAQGYDNIPIVASHMGCTGISYDGDAILQYIDEQVTFKEDYVEVIYKDRPRGIGRRFRDNDGKGETNFNPWSINLYNEEIGIIFDSGGMIGLNLDQRILGAQRVKGEFFSREELEVILQNKVEYLEGTFEDEAPDPVVALTDPVVAEHELSIFNRTKHLRHLCNHILHIVRIGGARAWQQLCIGSDFDGVINPINNCTSCAQYGDLEKDLVEMLGQMMGEAREEDPTAEFYVDDLVRAVRDIMYDNGMRFLKQWFA